MAAEGAGPNDKAEEVSDEEWSALLEGCTAGLEFLPPIFLCDLRLLGAAAGHGCMAKAKHRNSYILVHVMYM